MYQRCFFFCSALLDKRFFFFINFQLKIFICMFYLFLVSSYRVCRVPTSGWIKKNTENFFYDISTTQLTSFVIFFMTFCDSSGFSSSFHDFYDRNDATITKNNDGIECKLNVAMECCNMLPLKNGGSMHSLKMFSICTINNKKKNVYHKNSLRNALVVHKH